MTPETAAATFTRCVQHGHVITCKLAPAFVQGYYVGFVCLLAIFVVGWCAAVKR